MPAYIKFVGRSAVYKYKIFFIIWEGKKPKDWGFFCKTWLKAFGYGFVSLRYSPVTITSQIHLLSISVGVLFYTSHHWLNILNLNSVNCILIFTLCSCISVFLQPELRRSWGCPKPHQDWQPPWTPALLRSILKIQVALMHSLWQALTVGNRQNPLPNTSGTAQGHTVSLLTMTVWGTSSTHRAATSKIISRNIGLAHKNATTLCWVL